MSNSSGDDGIYSFRLEKCVNLQLIVLIEFRCFVIHGLAEKISCAIVSLEVVLKP